MITEEEKKIEKLRTGMNDGSTFLMLIFEFNSLIGIHLDE